jgi:pimaricinolide synthase PimS1
MSEPIAIIGMACRFPGGAVDPASYWDLLREGRDAVVDVPAERWNASAIFDEDSSALGKTYARWGGFLQEPIDRFDAAFFNIAPDEARFIDPQQRLLLEVAWEALENAGEDPTRLRGSRSGVFVGISYPEYLNLQLNPRAIQEGGLYVGLGGVLSVAAGRLSYVLGLQGPSVAIDTACSSSLVAIHQACHALRNAECAMALAGGVNLILTPNFTEMLTKMRALAKDGRCKTFDEAADGYVRSEGCGVLVLKRLSDALAQNDRIVAVIRGSAVNQDGASQGLTVPNALAQQALIEQALEAAGLRPADIDYLEAHGTGTPLGDAIEARAIGEAFRGGRAEPLYVGAVKTNLGHLESAAGVAGVMKVALALENELIPRNLNFSKLNPKIDLDRIPARVPTEAREWKKGARKRAAGVSGFALQGTNAHVVLEEAPSPQPVEPPAVDRPLHLLALSARSETALRALARRYLERKWDAPLADVCYTANAGRAHFEHRLAVAGATVDEVEARLSTLVASDFETIPAGVTGPRLAASAGSSGIAFLYSGGGAQYAQMGKRLYETQPTFRKAIDRCAEIVAAYREHSLHAVMFGDHAELLDRMDYMQPAIFAFEWAMTELWKSFGIEPTAVMGHSLGEYAAATVAGVFTLEDGLRLVCRRGQLMHEVEISQGEGAMAALAVDEATAAEALSSIGGRVSIAALNGPQSTVVSGEKEAVQRLYEEFKGRGVKAKMLAVSNAAHSPLMEPILDQFEEVADLVAYKAPRLRFVSNLTGREATSDDVCNSGYWTRHIRQPVRFCDGMQTLQRSGYAQFLEVGPHPVLLGMGQDCIQIEDESAWLPSVRRDADDWEQMLTSLGTLYTKGFSVDFRGFDRDYPHRRKVILPTYPFQRKSYWSEPSAGRFSGASGEGDGAGHPWIRATLSSAARPDEFICDAEIDAGRFAFLKDHVVLGRVVFPAAGFVELIAGAVASRWGGSAACVIKDMHFEAPRALDAAKSCRLQCVLSSSGEETEFAILGREGDAPWTTHVSGRIEIVGSEPAPSSVAVDELRERCPQALSSERWFTKFSDQGIDYGPAFRGVAGVSEGRGEALGEIVWPEEIASSAHAAYVLHPAVLDACIQVLSQCVDSPAENARVGLPTKIERLVWTGALPMGALVSHATLRESTEHGYVGDVRIMDADGRVLVLVEGLTVTLAEQAQLRQALGRPLQSLQHEVKWIEADVVRQSAPKRETWLVFADRGGVADELRARCEGAGIETILVAREGEPRSDARHVVAIDDCGSFLRQMLESQTAFDRIVFLWGLDESFSDHPTLEAFEADQRLGYASLLAIARELARAGKESPIRVVTRGVHGGAQPAKISQAPLWGLAKIIEIEHPELDCVAIDLSDDSAPLFDEIAAQAGGERQIRYVGERRFVARLAEKAKGRSLSEPVIDSGRSHLITGAFGGLGFETARRLVTRHKVRSLVLVGRRAPSQAQATEIESWRAQGVDVLVRLLDISKQSEVEALFAEIESGAALPLGGVFHAAGALADAALVDQTWERYSELLPAKAFGALNLHRASLMLKQPLDFMVLFSSASSLLGFRGQSNYAAVNACLDALARHRDALGLRTIAINWGVWSKIGRVADAADGSLKEAGVLALDPEEGMELLEAILQEDGPCEIGAFAVDWPLFLKTLHGDSEPPRFFENFARKQSKAARATTSEIVQRVLQAPVAERKALLAAFVQAEAAQTLGRGRDEFVDPQRGFAELGMDSLMTVQLRNRIKKQFGDFVKIPASLTFDHPNVEALADYLSSELARHESVRGAPARVAAQPTRSVAQEEDAVAIVGMGCRFPGGASSLDEYWKLLMERRSGVAPVPKERWDNDAIYDADPDAEGRTYARKGGFLKEPVDAFDAAFFKIVPGEAKLLDPQQRLLLEVVWEALEDAGVAPTELRGGATGVFVGVSGSDYGLLVQRAGVVGGGLYAGAGSSASFAAGRISHFLGLHGPSLTLDTACSSSLVALHQAAQSLKRGECTMALAGGVNLMLAPDNTILLSRARALSPSGECRAFDAGADGFVRGEGCGVVVLKRLSDALAAGDRIYAVICGSAVNHDGASSGLTVPNGSAQEALIREALQVSGVRPADVDYVEAHGTGTPLGDPIEARALGAALGGERRNVLRLGSVKTNLGHLEAAAGMAAVIKVALSLDREMLPPQLNFDAPNPNIALEDIPAQVVTEPIEWRREEGRRRIAGVSGFALQGTNAHVVLEEAPARAPIAAGGGDDAPGVACILSVSAQDAGALRDLAGRYAQALERPDSGSLLDFCASADAGRAQFPWRAALVARSRSEMRDKLVALAAAEPRAPAAEARRIAFLFTGQGSQYLGMGRRLYETFPVFRAALDRCAALFDAESDARLLDVMWGSGDADRLHQTEYTQVALFSLQYALVELWASCGVTPSAVMGHSVGEFAAAVAAGIVGLEDGLRLIADRGRLMQQGAPRGAMASIAASLDEVCEAVSQHEGKVDIAAINGPRSIVVSGETEAVGEIARRFEAQGTHVNRLRVSHAFHSALMDPILDDFEARASKIRFSAPKLRFVSSFTGAQAGEEICSPAYWREQLRRPVRFLDGARRFDDEPGEWIFVEIGPRPTLLALAQECVSDPQRHKWTPSLAARRTDDAHESEDASFLEALGDVYTNGASIRWKGLDYGVVPRKAAVPTYPFQRKRFWFEAQSGRVGGAPVVAVNSGDPLLGRSLDSPALSGKTAYELDLGEDSFAFVRDHVVSATSARVFPAAGFLETMLEAARNARPGAALGVADVAFERAAVLRPGRSHHLQCVVTSQDRAAGDIEVYFEDEQWARCASGRFAQVGGAAASVDIDDVRRRCRPAPGAELYAAFEKMGLHYGPELRGIERIWRGEGEALARIRLGAPKTQRQFVLDPAILDCCMQAFAGCLPDEVLGEALFLPVGVRALRCFSAPPRAREVYSHVRLVSSSQTGKRRHTADLTILDDEGAVIAQMEGLTVMETNLRSESDWTYRVEWETAAAEPAIPSALGDAVVVYAEDGETDAIGALRARLDAGVALSFARTPGEVETAIVERGARSVVFVAGGAEADALDEERFYLPCLEIIRILSRVPASAERARLVIVTRNALCVGVEQQAFSLFQAPLVGLARVARLERFDIEIRLIDAEPGSNAWVEELFRPSAEGEVALRGGARYVPRLTRARDLDLVRDRLACDPGKTYLVTGGLGALGLEAARWLVEEEGARSLLLIGRNEPGPAVRERLEELSRRTRASIETLALDVADERRLREALRERAASRPIGGVVHAAGALADATLERQDREKFAAVARPKIAGAWNLHRVTQELGATLDFFVCFSSAASLLGNAGQANYAAANAFLDLLAHERRRLGLPALTVNWGAWAGEGLAARGAGARAGAMTPMDPERAIRLFGRLLKRKEAQFGAFDVRWPELLEGSHKVAASTFFAEFDRNEGSGPESGAMRRTLAAIIMDSVRAERAEAVAQFLQEELAEALGGPVNPKVGFIEQGMDSLAAVEFRNRLKNRVGYPIDIPPTLIFDYPNLDSLTRFLLAGFEKQEPRADAIETSAEPCFEPADADVEKELMALIEAELEALGEIDTTVEGELA